MKTPEHNYCDDTLGSKIHFLRKQNNLTLEQLSQKSGLARSTLSKIENNLMSPTYDAMLKLAAGFEIDIAGLFKDPLEACKGELRVVTRKDQGKRHDLPLYKHQLLAFEKDNKRMQPFLTRITATEVSEFSARSSHQGEEFIYVLEGAIRLFTGDAEPCDLSTGDSVYFDSSLKHCCISTSEKSAIVLWISAT